MKLKTLSFSQRDSRWGSIMLGYNTELPYNLYNYGCLITSLGNYISKQPDEVNQILKDNGGFVQGGNFVWSKCTVLGLNQTYVSTRCQSVSLYTTEVDKLIGFLQDGYPALCEVDFNPADDPEQMHFVLAVGYTEGEIFIVDPWEGQLETWSFEAFKRNTYQYRIYDKKLTEDTIEETLPVLKKDFENLVRKSTLYDWIIQTLKITDSETVVKAEIPKFLGYEDTIHQQEKQLAEVQAKANEFATQAADKAQELVMLRKEMEELKLKVDMAISENQRLSKALHDLQEQTTVQSTKTWWQQLIDIFIKR